MMAELIVTDLNVLQRRIDVKAGKAIRLEISKAPIILMPKTIIKAVNKATSMFKRCVLLPVALANDSSNVIEKIRL